MFEFLFKYPSTAFAKGDLVFLSSLPLWVLAIAVLAVSALLGWLLWRKLGGRTTPAPGWRWTAIWALQASVAALLLVMLWRPALSVSTLKPHQNIVAVLVDDSRSMAIQENGTARIEQAREALGGGALRGLEKKFQVRTYRFGSRIEQVQKLEQITAGAQATHIGAALKQIALEASSLPIGAVVLVSDGADNTGGLDRETIAEVRRQKLPVHTVGVGREKMGRDVEITDAVVPARALADSRLSAQVTVRQSGYSGSKGRLSIQENGKPLASQQITFGRDGVPQTESILFNAGIAGAKTLSLSVDLLDGEENQRNNSLSRVINVEASKPRILYIEGEPRWEYKFMRRALEEDRSVQLVSITRTTQNKLYRQGIDPKNPQELEQGFPGTAEELFGYQGLIIGNVEAAYFTPSQQSLIGEFASRRGGGILFLGGRTALSDGGWAVSPLAELIPVVLPDRKNTFHREPAQAALTPAGQDSLICRLLERPDQNAERWKKMPALADYQEVGEPKPAALVLAEAVVDGRKGYPLLVTQNYGLGRVALFATGGSWRWKMLQDSKDQTHHVFWQQLARWVVSGTPSPVTVSTNRQVLMDEGSIKLRVQARNKSYTPLNDARVEAHFIGPEGSQGTIELTPSQTEPGVYEGEWLAPKPGSYFAEVAATRGAEVIGHDTITFRREDGLAEDFRTEQNRELLEKLAEETGGKYFPLNGLSKLDQEVTFSEAGLTTRELRNLWDMPALFLILLLLRAAEWLLRRKWGAV